MFKSAKSIVKPIERKEIAKKKKNYNLPLLVMTNSTNIMGEQIDIYTHHIRHFHRLHQENMRKKTKEKKIQLIR